MIIALVHKITNQATTKVAKTKTLRSGENRISKSCYIISFKVSSF